MHFRTDSKTVLYYLKNTTSQYNTFVFNRISFIRERVRISQWKFVKGSDNPADLASRGMLPSCSNLEVWLQGPKFLREHLIETEEEEDLRIPEGCEFKRAHTTQHVTFTKLFDCLYLV